MGARLGNAATVTAFARRRSQPAQELADQADQIARACYAMAARFHQNGKLIVFGNGGPSTDAQHVAVEFVHPVIVGKRALPALSLTADIATLTGIANRTGQAEIFSHQLRFVGDAEDIALGISSDGQCENVLRGLSAARERGMLTVALVGGDGGRIAAAKGIAHVLHARAQDPHVVKEIHVTIYHMLWELVHVFLEQPGVLDSEASS